MVQGPMLYTKRDFILPVYLFDHSLRFLFLWEYIFVLVRWRIKPRPFALFYSGLATHIALSLLSFGYRLLLLKNNSLLLTLSTSPWQCRSDCILVWTVLFCYTNVHLQKHQKNNDNRAFANRLTQGCFVHLESSAYTPFPPPPTQHKSTNDEQAKAIGISEEPEEEEGQVRQRRWRRQQRWWRRCYQGGSACAAF